MASTETMVTVDDTQISVHDSRDRMPPVVFANGAFSTQRAWRAVVDGLTPDLRAITFDMRGRGRSHRSEDYSLAAYERDQGAVIDGLELDKPALVGWSLGAHTILRWAAAHPGRYRGLVLVDGGYPFAWGDKAERESTRKLFRRQAWLLPLLAQFGLAGHMTAQQHADVVIELNVRAPQLVDAFANICAPIEIIVAAGGNAGSDADDSARMRASLDSTLAKHQNVSVFRTVASNHLQLLRRDPGTVVDAIRDLIART